MQNCDHEYLHDYGDHTYCFGCGKTEKVSPAVYYNYITPFKEGDKSNTSKEARPKVRAVLPESTDLSKQDYYRLRKRYHVSKATADHYAFRIIKRTILMSGPEGEPSEASYLLLPVADGFWQARWWGDDEVLKQYPKLKWWSQGSRELFVSWGDSLCSPKEVVIVEGVLDAARVSQVTNSMALCGTNIDESIFSVLPEECRVILFLDRDAVGKALHFQYHSSRKIRVIFAEKDPSEYTAKELRRELYA